VVTTLYDLSEVPWAGLDDNVCTSVESLVVRCNHTTTPFSQVIERFHKLETLTLSHQVVRGPLYINAEHLHTANFDSVEMVGRIEFARPLHRLWIWFDRPLCRDDTLELVGDFCIISLNCVGPLYIKPVSVTHVVEELVIRYFARDLLYQRGLGCTCECHVTRATIKTCLALDIALDSVTDLTLDLPNELGPLIDELPGDEPEGPRSITLRDAGASLRRITTVVRSTETMGHLRHLKDVEYPLPNVKEWVICTVAEIPRAHKKAVRDLHRDKFPNANIIFKAVES